jgi:hypothetical protein
MKKNHLKLVFLVGLLVFFSSFFGVLTIRNLNTLNGAADASTKDCLSVQQETLADLNILFVNSGDDPARDSYFTEELDTLGLNYDNLTVYPQLNALWPNATVLGQYHIVIWTTGEFYFGDNYMESPDYVYAEGNLTQYLQNGGRLFLSSQDWIWDMGISTFIREYLGVNNVRMDAIGDTEHGDNWDDNFTGVTGDPIGNGIPTFNVTNLGEVYGDYINETAPSANKVIHNTTNGDAIAVRNTNTTFNFKTVFFSVPFEICNTNRTILMERILLWLAADPQDGSAIPGFEVFFLICGLIAVGSPFLKKRLFSD